MLLCRYRGRLYDSCVRLPHDGEHYCAVATDEDHGVLGDLALCGEQCSKTICPVGFYLVGDGESCYQARNTGPMNSGVCTKIET